MLVLVALNLFSILLPLYEHLACEEHFAKRESTSLKRVSMMGVLSHSPLFIYVVTCTRKVHLLHKNM
jgi:hypothetical protein